MATKLTNSNLQSVIKQIPSKGFRTSFWREYRSSTAKGCGVAKALDGLEKLKVKSSGDCHDVKQEDLKAVIALYDDLTRAMTKARGKCGKFTSHTNDFCVAYSKEISKIYKLAVKLTGKYGDDLRAQKMVEEDARKERIRQFNERETEALKKFKDDKDEALRVILGEIKKTHSYAANICKLCERSSNLMTKADDQLAQIHKNWKSLKSKEGVNLPLEKTKTEEALRKVMSTAKLNDISKQIKTQLPSGVKEVTSAFQQFKQSKDNKKALTAAAKDIARARREFDFLVQQVGTVSGKFKSVYDDLNNTKMPIG